MLRIHKLMIVLALFCASILTGCATSKPTVEPLVRTELVYVTPPTHLLQCAPEPLVPDNISSDAEIGLLIEDIRLAGEDCRSQLQAVKSYLDKIPN